MNTAPHLHHIPARSRFHTQIDWLNSWHSFSFADHYSSANTHFGLLLVSNDDLIAPGAGFPLHPHKNMEIVTWVLSGELRHRDSAGNEGLITPGMAQRMSASSGIRHEEYNNSDYNDLHLLQMWVPPAQDGGDPGYEQVAREDALTNGALVTIASADPDRFGGGVTIHQPGARLVVSRLNPGSTVELPPAAFTHIFLAKGSGSVNTAGTTLPLATGDVIRLRGETEAQLTGETAQAEFVVWLMDHDYMH